MTTLTKETLDSWYTPRVGLNATEEDVAEESVCDMCLGTGEVTEYAYDSESHNYYSDGTRPCICQLREEQYDDQIVLNRKETISNNIFA